MESLTKRAWERWQARQLKRNIEHTVEKKIRSVGDALNYLYMYSKGSFNLPDKAAEEALYRRASVMLMDMYAPIRHLSGPELHDAQDKIRIERLKSLNATPTTNTDWDRLAALNVGDLWNLYRQKSGEYDHTYIPGKYDSPDKPKLNLATEKYC